MAFWIFMHCLSYSYARTFSIPKMTAYIIAPTNSLESILEYNQSRTIRTFSHLMATGIGDRGLPGMDEIQVVIAV